MLPTFQRNLLPPSSRNKTSPVKMELTNLLENYRYFGRNCLVYIQRKRALLWRWKVSKVSKEFAVSNFRVNYIMMMEAACSFEMLMTFNHITMLYIPENRGLIQRREKQKSYLTHGPPNFMLNLKCTVMKASRSWNWSRFTLNKTRYPGTHMTSKSISTRCRWLL